MATKKHVPAKAGKVTVKPVVKKIAKIVKTEPKKADKTAKVASAKNKASEKTVFKTVGKKTVNPATKKAVPKPVPNKAHIKPAPKKVAVKPDLKKVLKPIPKSLKTLTKATPKKVIQVKKVANPIVNKAIKNTITVKNIPTKAVNPAQKIMAKKEEVKTTNKKSVSDKPAAEVKAKDIKVPAAKPVVIPKISTKTVRKYQPDFTKSVLDKTQRDMGAPSQRYSDAELQEFRDLIQRKLEAAKKELSYLHGLITRKDELGGDEGDNRYMTMEDGSLSMEREQLSQMASRQITFIDHLEKAMMRIENKTYGICRVTGKLIDKARLRAVPHATLSIEAKMGVGK